MEDILPFENIDHITFTRKPATVPADLRPVYKIGLLLLFLKINSRSSTASILKIQFLNWAMKNDHLKTWLTKQIDFHELPYLLNVIHLDPSINRAIDFARGEKLIEQTSNGNIKLTPKGDKFASDLIADDYTMKNEKNFLFHLGKKLTEKLVINIIET